MILQKNFNFIQEIQSFSLVCSCESCIHFNEQTGKCSLGWPNDVHKISNIASEQNQQIIFCKEFDLK